jgi:hypothetical protein
MGFLWLRTLANIPVIFEKTDGVTWIPNLKKNLL